MASFNRLILAGRLTRDVELRFGESGKAFAKTGIAVSVRDPEKTLFIEVTMFGKTADVASAHLRKGSEVLFEGKLQLDKWTAKDGSQQQRHSMVVDSMQMLGGKPKQQQATTF